MKNKKINLSNVSGEVKSEWGVNRKLKTVYEKATALIPVAGECRKEYRKLERLRNASNLAHECFNNGFFNGRGKFCAFYNVEGASIPKYSFFKKEDWNALEIIVEKKLSGIIVEAFLEHFTADELAEALQANS